MEDKSRFSFLMDEKNNSETGSLHINRGNSQPTIASTGGRWSLLSDSDDLVIEEKSNTQQIDANPSANKKSDKYEKAELLKYRSEQVTITKVNGVIENHAETKLEFHVKRYIQNGQYMADVHIADNVLSIYPAQLQEALNLVIDVDNVKCNAILIIDEYTGRVKSIANMDDVQRRWAIQKQKIKERYAFVKSAEAQKGLSAFFEQSDEMMSEPNILQDYTTRPFYDQFFSKYLVSREIDTAPYTKMYYSQLFDRIPVQLTVQQGDVFESNLGMEVKRRAVLSKDQQAPIKEIENLYNQKYKNGIGYKFSEYVYEHQVSTTVNVDTNILESASMIFTEAVLNNLEITADYKLRRIQ